MKNFIASLFLLTTSILSFGAQEPTNENDTNEVSAVVVEEISAIDLTFGYKNRKDSLTLELQEDGKLTISWSGISNGAKYIAFKYSKRGTKEWKTVSAPVSDSSLSVSGIIENQIFKYYLGSGSGKNDLTFNEDPAYFNSFSETIFKSNQAKGKEESAAITWGIKRDLLNEIVDLSPGLLCRKVQY